MSQSIAVAAVVLFLFVAPAAQTQIGNFLHINVGGNPLAEVLTKTVTLTDAQVKALPTTPITLVAAPGSGKYLAWRSAHLFTKFAAGAYTNIDAAFAQINLSINSLDFGTSIVSDNTTTPALTTVSRFLGAAARHARIVPFIEAAGGGGEQYIITSNADGTSGIDTTASLVNQALSLTADNNGAGNWTGGNSANTLTIIVLYSIVTVP